MLPPGPTNCQNITNINFDIDKYIILWYNTIEDKEREENKMANKIFTIVLAILIIIIFMVSTSRVDATVKGINSKNYDSYIKPIADEYGYNIGECEKGYLVGEEYFYNDYYDHWNVDKVYDSSLIPKEKVKEKKAVKKNKKKNKKKIKRKNNISKRT